MAGMNSTSETNITTASKGDWDKENILQLTILSALAIITIAGNLLVFNALRYVKDFRFTSKVIIASLALADLLVGAVLIPMRLAEVCNFPWTRSTDYCRLTIALHIFTLSASLLNLLAMSFERYLYMQHPMKYPLVVTRRKVLSLILIIWVASSAVASVCTGFGLRNSTSIHRYDTERTCQYMGTLKPAYLVFVSVWYLFPMVMLVGIYVKILSIAQGKRRRTCRIRIGKAREVAGLDAGANYQWRCLSAVLSTLNGRDRKAAILITALLGTFVTCWMPSVLELLVRLTHSHLVTGKVSHAVLVFVYSNSFWNSVMYYIFSKQFRISYRRVLCCSTHDATSRSIPSIFCGVVETFNATAHPKQLFKLEATKASVHGIIFRV